MFFYTYSLFNITEETKSLESNDGIVLVWSVDESEDFPSLRLIDKLSHK